MSWATPVPSLIEIHARFAPEKCDTTPILGGEQLCASESLQASHIGCVVFQ